VYFADRHRVGDLAMMFRRTSLLLLCFTTLCFGAAAQDTPADGTVSLVALLKKLPTETTDVGRDSVSATIKIELRALLEQQDAMTRSFDAVPISRIDAPDGAFRLFTWNVPHTAGIHRYEGLLLVPSRKGPVVHELRDATSAITAPEVPELGTDRWYGALYYQVVPVKKGAKTYYTLLGWKGYSAVETRKVIEVLHFKGSQPRFGAPLFGSGKLRANRKVYGYAFQASMMLRHEPNEGMIVLDHLSPQRADMAGQWAFYGPDLSYDAFIWDKGHWRYERDIDARDRKKDGRPFNAPPPEPKP
jgi:hypothetical protein